MVAAGVKLCRVLAALALLALACIAAPALAADGPLSKPDEARYRAAFAAADRGDFDEADAVLAKVKDRSLIGHVEFVKLMHPTAYRATYPELVDWLGDHGELGGAERIYALAQKRQPRGAREPAKPSFLAAARVWMQAGNETTLGDASFAARDAYYSGRTAEAWALAPSADEPWIAALAGWRLGKVSEAAAFFLKVAEDDGNDDWLRSAAWFWAGRCAERLGDRQAARGYFQRAAGTPYTFYGLIATRKLEMEGGREIAFKTSEAPPAPRPVVDDIPTVSPLLIRVSSRDQRKADSLIERDARAQRAAALVQIDRPVEAAQELRVGLALARSDTDQKDWQTLIVALKVPLQVAPTPTPGPAPVKKKARPYRAEPYDVPELYPDGGFTLDKALVYALVRQESRFNPYAYSHAGAVGLMQVRPTSAAEAAGDDHLLYNIMPLFDPPVNLRIGQDYMTWLMERGLGGGDDAYDLFRVIAAYNGGAGAVIKTRKRMEPDADALLFMESLPARETREYVEKVAFGYWTYRRMWGQPTPTLDQAARYERIVNLRSDR
ncbi:lytic transglycosylase domain-containing protein [Caulobacter sp. NIBR1757]|uniref:lytic transglycosylase domain-containing protein n=1 Tax=Caulobacter sp. NIBR1757 TaxID=3016000 RepID=UPI0022F005D8|nr:lytic transglycosylase domain-containing protein [Caulobacter sp. NIBR1757]WGM40102.1 Membrane-bound lytic murein transglycosylase C [Caulobacter sp. NIBR1757]